MLFDRHIGKASTPAIKSVPAIQHENYSFYGDAHQLAEAWVEHYAKPKTWCT